MVGPALLAVGQSLVLGRVNRRVGDPDSELVSAGGRSAQIGMYLAGDVEAASLAEQLRLAQETRAKLVAGPSPKPNVLDAISCQTVGLLSPKKKPDPAAAENVAKAERALADAEARLKQLAR